jgi:phosphatidylglycerophosphate synthase
MNRDRIPAIILCAHAGFDLEIAGLSVLDRLLVTLSRAGCGPLTIVSKNPLPALRRAGALGIEWRRIEESEVTTGDAIAAAANLVIQVDDVREVIRQRGQLVAADGNHLPLKFIEGGTPADLSDRAGLAMVRAVGVARRIDHALDARRAAQELWASLKSSSDGTVDKYFNRPVGRLFSKLLVRTPVTPNQISVASIVIGLVGAWFLACGDRVPAILGAVLFQLSAVVDCMDGDVARMVFKESPLGKWLDIVGDQVVHTAIFIGIAVGLAGEGSSEPVGWLAASAVLGALISFGVILRGMLGGTVGTSRRLQALIDAATNRDFSVLVLVLAICQRLEWFLWMAAIGAHLFWMAALALQVTADSRVGQGAADK